MIKYTLVLLTLLFISGCIIPKRQDKLPEKTQEERMYEKLEQLEAEEDDV